MRVLESTFQLKDLIGCRVVSCRGEKLERDLLPKADNRRSCSVPGLMWDFISYGLDLLARLKNNVVHWAFLGQESL